MITNTMMTPAAEAAAQRYGLLVEGWRSLFRFTLDRADFGSPRSFSAAQEQAYVMANTYLDSERAIIAERIAAVAKEAHRDAHEQIGSETPDAFTDELDELLSETVDYLAHEIVIQTERDIAFLMRSLRQTALQVRIAANAQGIPEKAALIQHRIGHASELHFFFHDRGGQKWPSRRFIRSVWRLTLLSAYNETMLLTLSEAGIDRAQVYHVNPGAQSHGMILAMHSGSQFPTYAEVRNEIFHPNADAILGKIEEE